MSPDAIAAEPFADEDREPLSPFDRDTAAFAASLLFHFCLLLILGLVPREVEEGTVTRVVATATPPLEEPELQSPQEFSASDEPAPEIGAESVGDTEIALSMAPEVSNLTSLPTAGDDQPALFSQIALSQQVQAATGIQFNENLLVKGAAGVGVTGALGAIDRLTEEILRSLEERKTLVVWLFDQSGSLARQRAAISERFDRIYEELGVIEASGNSAFRKHDAKPLLTAVGAFGKDVSFLTKQPTDNLSDIKAAVAAIPLDSSGIERVFTAVALAADRYKHHTNLNSATQHRDRNVLLIVFTDEAGEDQDALESTIKLCRRQHMPVYVVGVPAAFGVKQTLVKWVDPDPQFDQTPRWGEVDQGPETCLFERLRLAAFGDRDEPDPLDSGFGPYALTRLCYETGGVFFAVHPNRVLDREISRNEVEPFAAHLKYFFDPRVMRRYQPDYVSSDEYVRRASANKARVALLESARLAEQVPAVKSPRLRFVKRSAADLTRELAAALKEPAAMESSLAIVCETLRRGEKDRAKETTPRWQAGFDLALGQALARYTRTLGYNVRLVEVQRGLRFQDPNRNTWVLEPSAEDVPDQRLAGKAKEYLQRVVEDHPGTPWAVLAKAELAVPLGWRWTEHFTDLMPRPRHGGGGGGGGGGRGVGHGATGRPVEQRPPTRPVPKL